MNNETYNGWTNYATWKVNLELVDYDYSTEAYQGMDTYDISEALKEDIEEYVSSTARDTIAETYALAFLNGVNWYEIAEHIVDAMEAA